MSVQIYVVRYDANSVAAEAFCADYALWSEVSSVNDYNALDELARRYKESDLTEVDEFIIFFDGDYITIVSSNDLRYE